MSEPVTYESIAHEWFPRIADRLRHPMDPDTIHAYCQSFRRAQITPRGLVVACEQLFDGSKWWPSPAELIAAAKAAEVKFLMAERPADTNTGSPSRTAEELLAAEKAFAQPWVDANRAEYDAIVAGINAEVCSRFRLASPKAMSPTQKVMRDAMILRACAKRAYDAARAAAPVIGRELPPKPGWQQQVARARQKVAEMMGKPTPPAGSSSVSGGSQPEQRATE